MPTSRMYNALPARPESIGQLRGVVGKFALRSGADMDVTHAVRLAVSEALTNVVMHAYRQREPGDMTVEAWLEEGRLVVRVWDEGVGLVPRPDSPGMGIGLAVMAQAADEFAISNRDDVPGTLVELRFALSRASLEDLSLGSDML